MGLKLNHVSQRGPDRLIPTGGALSRRQVCVALIEFRPYFSSRSAGISLKISSAILKNALWSMKARLLLVSGDALIQQCRIPCREFADTWWRHQMETFPRYWPFMRRIHRSPVNSPHKGQWRGALMFSLICEWINGWVNNREAGDLRRHRAHYEVIVMNCKFTVWFLIHLDSNTIKWPGHESDHPMNMVFTINVNTLDSWPW